MQLELRERLGRLAELSNADLDAFHLEIVDALGALGHADNAGAIGELTALQLASESVRRQFDTRQHLALSASEPEHLTAAGQLRRMAARQRRPRRNPEAARVSGANTLIATGALRGVQQGEAIGDRWALAEAMSETLQRMPRDAPARGDVVLASARWHYPEERQLGDDQGLNARTLDAVTHPQALLATGGICAPTNVDYAVPTWATADRPIRDGLPAFEASRGGVLYVQPPDVATYAAATAVWTEATDASPGASTKPVVSIVCGNTVQVYTEAVSTRLGFGNMQARFAPEQVAAATDLAVAAASRFAEDNLLTLIAAQCVTGVTTAILLGATRDLLTAVDQACAGYRNAHRIPRSQALCAIFPDWVKDLLRADLVRETAHQQDSDWNSLAVTDEQIEDLFTVRGVKPIFHLDGQASSVSGGVAQTFAIQTGTGVILTFPGKLVWYLFVEGSIQFLDGGRLDLGIVRDSTLDATNDFEEFVETFETIAYRGFTSGAVQIVSSLCANGTSAGTTSTASACA